LVRFVNLYDCSIGGDTRIGTCVEIQMNSRVGSHCKISSRTFIWEGVAIEDDVFVGNGVLFTIATSATAAATSRWPKTSWLAACHRQCTPR
jgi:UDP-3-O-[3-hydroxymyristoyl] glucosamine N-acyltransferase